MRKQFRIGIATAALLAGLSVVGASSAEAGVSFQGTFPLPHGSISIGIGDPAFGVGAFVPYGYNVAYVPDYGYGFYYGNSWIPCRPYQSRWIVCDRPFYNSYAGGAYVGGGYGYGYGYPGYGGYHAHPYHRPVYGRGYYDHDGGYGHGGYGGHQGEGPRHDGGYDHGGGNGHYGGNGHAGGNGHGGGHGHAGGNGHGGGHGQGHDRH